MNRNVYIGRIKTHCHKYNITIFKYKSFCNVFVESECGLITTNLPILIIIDNKVNVEPDLFGANLLLIFEDIVTKDPYKLPYGTKRDNIIDINYTEHKFFEEGTII